MIEWVMHVYPRASRCSQRWLGTFIKEIAPRDQLATTRSPITAVLWRQIR
ncbi:MAG: hypothetical protein QOF11_833 [Chloroflexota bacterium]|nr:hypothetical protein [Chloroflexota bacterium]